MNKKRILAAAMSVTVGACSLSAGASPVFAADRSSDEKEEVIYAMLDASGQTESVNVVNIFGSGSKTDYGDYSSVKMLNTTDSIQQDGEKISFSSDKERVYYQGSLENAQLPWKIKFTYKLDGKEVSADDLAGASGEVEIHIKIEKNDACEGNFYDNYALQLSFSLDTDKCENIEADGATLANSGANKQISYTVLPGKGLDAIVKTDADDFEMSAVSINGIQLNLNVEIDDEELLSKVTEIMDAAESLNDGAIALSDGSEELLDGSNSLTDGSESLSEGAKSLEEGISSLQDGTISMQEALELLNAQSGNLTNGSKQVYSALKTIQDRLSAVNASTEQLATLTSSSAAIKEAIASLTAGAEQLQQGVSYEAYKAAMQQGGLDVEQLQSLNSSSIENIQTQISTLKASLEQIQAIEGYESDPELAAQAASLEASINSLSQVIQLLSVNNGAISGTESYLNALEDGADTLAQGLESLQSSYESFDAAINSLVNSLGTLLGNVNELKEGINTLVSSYESLDSGIEGYTDAVATILASYNQIVSGTETLADGSKELSSGADSLLDGSKELSSGCSELNDGAKEMSNGTGEFYEKTDGMDSKIEEEIDDMIASISGGDAEVVSFVSDKNTNVKAVQFVIKTASIEEEEETQTEETQTENTGLWQKLLNLFGL